MKFLFLSLIASMLFLTFGGCASTPDDDEKYAPDVDNEKALQERLTKMRRQNQGF
jgi:hypothetical protein